MSTLTTTTGLKDVQGNILKGHGRGHAALMLFRFGAEADRNREMLRNAGNPGWFHHATSAQEQAEQARELHRWDTQQGTHRAEYEAARTTEFRSLAITGEGLQACGWERDTLENRFGWRPPGEFWEGMTDGGLLDPVPWSDPRYQKKPHGVWLVANDDRTKCTAMAARCKAMLEGYGATVQEADPGWRWTPDGGELSRVTREPFGFMDGFAKTQVAAPRGSPLSTLISRVMNGVLRKAEPYDIPIERVMLNGRPEMAGSSFLVLRKLEQNVHEFLRAEAELRPQLDRLPPAYQVEDPGALFIGRNRNGKPLTNYGVPMDNTFHFGADQEAARCPFHAHIRKMNLRQNTSPGRGDATRTHQKAAQFARRGLVYGAEDQFQLPWLDRTQAPKTGVGLMFMAYMSDITRQFVTMHAHWALDPRFPTEGNDDTDPLFTRPATPDYQPLEWKWERYGLKVTFQERLVTPVGGAYFFVPNLPWLQAQ